MILSKDRRMYDLCRKYKYYYKSYKEVEKLRDVYWSKYINEAYKEVKCNLEKVEDEIIYMIFSELLGECPKIEVEKLFDDRFCSNNLVKPMVIGEKVSIYEKKFNEKIQEVVDRQYREYYGYEM